MWEDLNAVKSIINIKKDYLAMNSLARFGQSVSSGVFTGYDYASGSMSTIKSQVKNQWNTDLLP